MPLLASWASAGVRDGRLGRVPLLELLDDLALLGVLGRSLGGLDAGRGVPLLLLGDLVASLGVRLVPLAFLYAATPAVYAHDLTSLPRAHGHERGPLAVLGLPPVVPCGGKRKPRPRERGFVGSS